MTFGQLWLVLADLAVFCVCVGQSGRSQLIDVAHIDHILVDGPSNLPV